MKAVEISIHNFRSICDASITLAEYGILVGVNNAGKTTVIDAIRAFYGKGVKFDKSRDFPHKGARDNESWVEIEFKPSADEIDALKDEYRSEDDTFRVRNYLFSDKKDKDGKEFSGPYAYANGELSGERFYGFKNVGQGKFGEIIYIPAVSKIDEHTRLTGPSALRDLVNSVLSRVMEESGAYQALSESFNDFEGAIKTESTAEGYSLQSIEADISNELSDWGAGFRLNISPVGIDDIIKGLVNHEIIDGSLDRAQPISAYGQGFQRSVIYTLIRVAAKYGSKKKTTKKKEFAPELTWVLFEEPEAFLHPTQVSSLNSDLSSLADSADSQVLLSTHNPQFATHSIRNITAICRLQREDCRTKCYQVSSDELDSVLTVNQQDAQVWQAAGIPIDQNDLQTDMEAVKYALWLDQKRSAAFFAEKVLLVEGPTETALLAYMFDHGLLPDCRGVFVMDTIGKYNIHRFMRLFQSFGIRHYVLYDFDSGRHAPIDQSILAASNEFTGGIETFPEDLERFMGIAPAGRPHRKPQHVMLQVAQNGIDLNPLAAKINALVSR
ncbi:ATP-dependent OLD family endonuclease [Alcanivorax venustensis ISO4]|uniref:ATP-dependent OLD family endonuclease n=1 Tax=Alloalcanivorax venustensis ISO4 TaxID=1177184 RepID=A0ABS0ALU1_9GAMM|nr:AAA family ATPase [Alloalcanivorax venustensis]MBF5054471.1 ATP-dependent OLD family endonuclease [Alloalcanivorax venustensis ISO4]